MIDGSRPISNVLKAVADGVELFFTATTDGIRALRLWRHIGGYGCRDVRRRTTTNMPMLVIAINKREQHISRAHVRRPASRFRNSLQKIYPTHSTPEVFLNVRRDVIAPYAVKANCVVLSMLLAVNVDPAETVETLVIVVRI